MPYQIIWEGRVVRWKFFGTVTSREAVQSNMEIYGDPRFDNIRFQIADFSEVEALQFEEKDMKKVAFLDKAAGRSNPNIHVAIIAPSENTRNLLEAYSKYSVDSPWTVTVFDSCEQADHWLSVKIESR